MNKPFDLPVMNEASALPAAGAVAPELADLAPAPWWRRPWVWFAVIVIAVVAAGAWKWWTQAPSGTTPAFVTEPVARGNLRIIVTANGTL
ncbi:MAG: hypothetical protein ABI593_11335, partial [Betaproteobacteria bacterium]